MRAHQLITGASFGPVAIKAMSQAFDEAWEEIASHFDGDPLTRDNARQSLAEAVLAVAGDSLCNIEALKEASLLVMARNYKLTCIHRVRARTSGAQDKPRR